MVLELLVQAMLAGAFLLGCVALLAGGRRAYLLARYAVARPRRVDAADPKPGRRWLRLTGEVTAVDDALDGPTGDPATVAYRVQAHRQERLSGVPWPRATTSLLDETTHAPFALRASGRALRVGEGEASVVGPRWNEKGSTYTPADPPPDPLDAFLAARDVAPDRKMGDGRVFDHDLRVNSTVVTAGDMIRLFGLLDVRRNGTMEIAPDDGPLGDVCFTTGPWRTLWVRYLHELLRAFWGGGLLVLVAGYLLWPQVASVAS